MTHKVVNLVIEKFENLGFRSITEDHFAEVER